MIYKINKEPWKLLRLIICSSLIIACAQKSTLWPEDTFTDMGPNYTVGGKLSPTVYYIPRFGPEATQCSNASKKTMHGLKNQTLTRLCPKYYKDCLLQGTCQIKNSSKRAFKTYNFIKFDINGTAQFKIVRSKRCAYGNGSGGDCLIPYRSIAADAAHFKLGQIIYIPSAKGTLLPNGETHDGYFIVHDRGGAIKGTMRFDFFTGYDYYLDEAHVFRLLGFSDPKKRFSFYVVSGESAKIITAQLGSTVKMALTTATDLNLKL